MIFCEMDTTDTNISFSPIGTVRNGINQTPRKANWQLETISELVIDRNWTEAVEGLEEFSHIIVIFYFDRISDPDVLLKVHPMHREDLPVTGMFATRTPNRPNRIGETAVKLIGRRDNILLVSGLDALDGTPILDIKPYLSSGDYIPGTKEPHWVQEAHG